MVISCVVAWMLAATVIAPARGSDYLEKALDRLRRSDIEFQRSGSNAPFIPFAYLGARRYGDARLVNDLQGSA